MPSPFPNLPPYERGAVVAQWHSSRVLRGNPWGDPTERDLHIYLPQGYTTGDAPLPCVLFLAGYSGTGEKFFSRGLTDPSLPSRIDALIAQGCPPFIGVFPDVMTRVGGSQYVDSPAIGAYATYLIDEVRPFVDARYRTSGAWGAIGHSSGGFGALHLAMNHAGALQAIGCHAADLGFDLCYLGDIPRAIAGIQAAGGLARFIATFWDNPDPDSRAFAAMNLIAMSCAYSPAPGAPDVPADLPFDPITGAVHYEVLQRWGAWDPLQQVLDPARVEALRGLRLLYLDAGSRDEYLLHLGARRLAQRLTALAVPHTYEEFVGSHRSLSRRYEVSLPRVVAALGGR